MIGRAEIDQARQRIAPYVRRTPAIRIQPGMFGSVQGALTFKLESSQVTGSFKPRGVFNRLLKEPFIPKAGVVAASGGNHGAAVAYAAQVLGLPCEIFLPSIAPVVKREQLMKLGAQIIITGAVFAESLKASEERARDTGALPIHAYDDAAVVAGQGTVAAELEEQAVDLDTVLIAVGGGGFVGGVAAWYSGRVRVVAVEPVGSPSYARAREAGQPIDIETGGLAADSLGCRSVGHIGFAIADRFVDQALVVSEDSIRRAQRLLWDELRVMAEPGGAVGLAALVEGLYTPEPGERVGIVVCGGNVDPCTIFENVSART